jgi:hypothetical protein
MFSGHLSLPGRAAFALALVFSSSAAAEATISITRWSVDSGGTGFVQAGTFLLGGTIGQPDASLIVTPPYLLYGGFWTPGGSIPVTAVPEVPPPASDSPITLKIHPATPNPVLDRTRLSFDLPEAGPVEIRIFALDGGLVRTVQDAWLPAGHYRNEWNVTDSQGRRVSPGVYLVRFRLSGFSSTQKIVVIR